MAKGKATQSGKSNGAQNKRPVQNGKATTRVVKSAGSQRPKVGAKANVVKARAVVVSAKPKPTTNNRVTNKPVAKVNNNRPKQVVTKQATAKAPRQKIILQESQRKVQPNKPTSNQTTKQTGNRNAPANSSNNRNNNSRPTSAGSSTARPKSAVNNSSAAVNQSELARALQTANSIAITRSHPKQAEVVQLLGTHEKGWVDDRKFITLLKSLAF